MYSYLALSALRSLRATTLPASSLVHRASTTVDTTTTNDTTTTDDTATTTDNTTTTDASTTPDHAYHTTGAGRQCIKPSPSNTSTSGTDTCCN